MKENLYYGTLCCLFVMTVYGLNSGTRAPFHSIGKIPQMIRGLHMVYLCILILIVVANYEDAREIVSIFNTKPSEETLKR